MPVQVQLPGYNHAAPGLNLLQAIDAGFGAYDLYKEGQAADIKNQAAQAQLTQQQNQINELSKPDSLATAMEGAATSSVLKQIDPQHPLLDIIQKGMPMKKPDGSPLLDAVTGQQKMQKPTGIDIRNFLDTNPAIKEQVDLTKAKMMAQAAGAKAAGYADRNIGSITKDYDKEMGDYKNLHDDVTKLDSIFNTKDKNGNPLITKQQMGDANAIISRIYSPKHMSDATVSRTEYESAPAMFAGALQKLSTDPTDVGSRALIEHIVDQGHHLANVSNSNALNMLDQLDAGYSNLAEPAAQRSATAKSQSYRKMFGKTYQTMGAEGQQDSNPMTSGGVMGFDQFMKSKKAGQ